MQKERKLTALKRALGQGHQKKDEWVFFCPKHGASAGRSTGQLSVNIVTDRFHCWSCGWGNKSSLAPIIRLSGDRSDLSEYLDSKVDGPVKVPDRTYVKPYLPEGFVSLSSPSRSIHCQAAMAYLSERGVGSSDILRYKIGYCEQGEYRGRVIFPSFDEYGELNFFVGRKFYENGFGMRYKHDEFDKDIIFNDYLVDWSKPVTLVEGPVDMVKAGDNAIPLQGSDLNETSRLFRKIVSRETDVYFAMDADAFKKQLRVIRRFLAYGVSSHYVDLAPRKDPGQMSKEEFQEHRSRAKRVESEFDLIRVRIGG